MTHYFNTGPSRFVLNEGDKLRPTGIANRLGEGMVFDHAFDIQTFQADAAKLIDDLATQFVVKVFTSIRDLLVGGSDDPACLIPTVAFLRFTAKASLSNLEQSFRFAQVLWRFFLRGSRFTVEDRKVFQAEIDAHIVRLSRGLNVRFNFALNGDEIFTGLGFRHGAVFHLAFNPTMTTDFYPSDFGQVNLATLKLEVLWKARPVGTRLLVKLASMGWVAVGGNPLGAIFARLLSWWRQCAILMIAEKVLKSLIQVFQRLLQNLRIGLFQPF